jgi:hypothetical protein
MTTNATTQTATSPEKAKAQEYLTTRAEAMTAQQIRARMRAAVVELESAIDGVRQEDARASVVPGEWTIAQATARTILVFNRPDGTPEFFDMDLTWKGYAMTQRLHLLDHRSQIRTLREQQGRTA